MGALPPTNLSYLPLLRGYKKNFQSYKNIYRHCVVFNQLCIVLFNLVEYMILKYIEKAMEKADYKKLEDNSWFGEIPDFTGVWSNADNLEECRRELIEVLEEWILLKTKDNELLPVMDEIDINIKLSA